MTETTAVTTTPEPLTQQQQRLLAALMVDPDIKTASETAGVSRSTAHRWLREPVFRDELARQRDAVLTETMDSVKTHATRAMSELARLLSTDDDRLRRLICNDILGHALRVRELEDIERRLAVLEKAAKKSEKESECT